MLPVTDWPWNKKNTSELGRLETQENPTATNVMGRLHGHAMFVIMGCTALPIEHYNGQSVNKEWDTPTGCVQATDIIFTTFHLQSFYSWTVWFQNSLHTVMNLTSTFAVLPVLCVKSFAGIWYSDMQFVTALHERQWTQKRRSGTQFSSVRFCCRNEIKRQVLGGMDQILEVPLTTASLCQQCLESCRVNRGVYMNTLS